MQKNEYEWDFFLAHAGGDVEFAERLYDALASGSRVFLDSRCLRLGDDWDTELASAQRRSLISVVLVSRNTPAAYYQREEVAAAIALAREASDIHRVVPIYIDPAAKGAEIPYGLRLKHGITLGDECGLADAAVQLLDLRRSLDSAHTRDSGDTQESKTVKIPSARGLKIKGPSRVVMMEMLFDDETGMDSEIKRIYVDNSSAVKTYDNVRVEINLPAALVFINAGANRGQESLKGHVVIPLSNPVNPGDSLEIGYVKSRSSAKRSKYVLEWKITARDVSATSGDLNLFFIRS